MNILDIVFPKICLGCGKEGKYICCECAKTLVKPQPICPMCGKSSLDGYTHHGCKRPLGIEKLVVGLSYKGLSQKSLKKVKYKNAWDILASLFECAEFPALHNLCIVEVPMWGPKERERGFNQATIIVDLLCDKYCHNSEIIKALERTRDTKPMYGLKKEERNKNIDGAFAYNRLVSRALLEGKDVLLVDDVWTTGSTMRECAKVLKRAGAKTVWAITLAR